MKKRAIITFDYEVFLGRQTGTVENSVLRPTEAILKILKENNGKAIFFVDATWLLFIKQKFPVDFQLVSSQLKMIVESGSSVELHIHPQWIDATVTDNQIDFSTLKHYKLHSLSNEEIVELFARSVDLLESITKHKISCFRAGGWCIEPFNKIKDAFEMFGIKYDFSVVPGIFLKEGKAYDFDYSKAPELQYYKFQNDVLLPSETGAFTEIPLSTYRNNLLYRVLNKVLLKYNKDFVFGDGIGSKEKSLFRTIIQASRFSKDKLSLDKTGNLLFRYLLQTHLSKSDLLVVVSHPKIVSEQALKNLAYISCNFCTLNSKELDSLFVKH